MDKNTTNRVENDIRSRFETGRSWKRQFQRLMYEYYSNHKRVLPWRTRISPYRVLVSELMLQQTQVDRVIPKFYLFLRLFPNFKRLSEASLAEVLTAWSGLGYPRRAKYLHLIAKGITDDKNGRLPQVYQELIALPGIGSYTASAVRVFAFNQEETLIETNIRAVFCKILLKGSSSLSDADIEPLVEESMDRENPREWYSALMDYGAMLKREGYRSNALFSTYTRPKSYVGSKREIRGFILRNLEEYPHGCRKILFEKKIREAFTDRDFSELEKIIEALVAEELISFKGQKMYLG